MRNETKLKNKLEVKLSRILYWTVLGIRSALFPLYKIPFVIIIILIGYYALSINDQGQDMMAAFGAKKIWSYNYYLLLFEIFLLFWAISIWNVARALLSAANLQKLVEKEIEKDDLIAAEIDGVIEQKKWVVASIDPNYKKMVSFMIKWIPRVLAMCPYLIFIGAYDKQNKLFDKGYSWNIIVVMIIAISHFLYMMYRKRLSKKFFPKSAAASVTQKKDPYSLEEEKNFLKALKKEGIVINTFLTVLMTVVMFIYSLSAANDIPSSNGKPGLIILAGFTVYTLIGLLLNLLINRYRIPVFILLVVFALFWASKFNNNHSLQVLKSAADSTMLAMRHDFSDSAYIDYWIDKKLSTHVLDSTKDETIFIVAAEGGGIRNCYWTYKVLDTLQQINPNFYKKTFAVTGVSGGSIGLGFYYNFRYYYDSLLQSGFTHQQLNKKIDSISSADYLSRVTYGFMFPDLIQRFIPARIDSWDRSKYLANSFDDGFSHYLLQSKTRKSLSENYLKMWSDTATAYRHPVILFNTIFNEDGTNAIFSPYRLSDTYYPDVMDLLYESNRSVPMKEAMVSSARFPILTAPGLVWHDTLVINKDRKDTTRHYNSAKLGHISDGGGFENTGILTAMQTALLFYNRINERHLKKMKVRIIYIGSGINSIKVENKIPADHKKHNDPIGRAYEIAWLKGGANTIFGWIKSSYNISARLNKDLDVLKFGLEIKADEKSHSLPLGWYLSDTSRIIIANQVSPQKANKQFKESIVAFKKFN